LQSETSSEVALSSKENLLKNGNKINKSEFTDNVSDFGGTVLETEDIV